MKNAEDVRSARTLVFGTVMGCALVWETNPCRQMTIISRQQLQPVSHPSISPNHPHPASRRWLFLEPVVHEHLDDRRPDTDGPAASQGARPRLPTTPVWRSVAHNASLPELSARAAEIRLHADDVYRYAAVCHSVYYRLYDNQNDWIVPWTSLATAIYGTNNIAR